MQAPRILVTTPYLQEGDDVDTLLKSEGCQVSYSAWHGERAPGELAALLGGVDGVLAGTDRFTAEVLRAAPDLKVISRTGVGHDSIDTVAAGELGITVCNAPGVNRNSVAELTIALMLMCARRVTVNIDDMRAGQWRRLPGGELKGATLGLVGCGSIGQAVAELATAFGMRLVAYDPFPDAGFAERTGLRYLSADEVLRQADFLSLHLFLNDDTRHWLDAERLALMKPTAYVINTARGPVVDEAALARELADGGIAGAGLDVVETEPLPLDSPLRGLDTCVITPHLGGSTTQARGRGGLLAARNVLNILKGGNPVNVVNAGHLKANAR